MKVGVVIVGAGSGDRLGKVDKLSIKLAGTTLLNRAVLIFSAVAEIAEIVVVVSPARLDWARNAVTDTIIIEGGSRRRDSVLNGLNALSDDVDYVLVHDVARPFVTVDLIKTIINAFSVGEDAVICGVKVSDTIKAVSDGYITETLPRDKLLAAHTPQGFNRALLTKAYNDFTDSDFTDDAQAVERLGVKVKVVDSPNNNFKITYPNDLEFARILADKRSIDSGK